MRNDKNESTSFLQPLYEVADRYGDKTAIIDLNSGNTEKEYNYDFFLKLVKKYADNIKKACRNKHQQFIGLSLPKSIHYYAMMLAIMETGNIYIPLPVLPVTTKKQKEHYNELQQRASTLHIDVLICSTSSDIKWRKKLFEDKTITSYSQLQNKISISASNNLTQRGKEFPPKDPIAYIINTSGTTSNPKSIVISQRCVISTIQDSIRLMKIPEGANLRVLQRSELNKDPSIFELLLGLLSGNCIVSLQESVNPANAIDMLPNIIRKYSINVLLSPPDRLTTYKQDPDKFPAEWSKSLGFILSTTDKAAPDTLEYYLSKKHIKVFDGYGPTETTIGLMICELDLAGTFRGTLGNINQHMFSNRTIKVFNTEPSGNIEEITEGRGELCIAGRAVMLGYCKNGQLLLLESHELADQRIHYDSIMYYRTGDLVEITPEKNLIFIDRISGNKKISGNFVTPTEEIKNRILKKLKEKSNEIFNISVSLPDKYKPYRINFDKQRVISISVMLRIMMKDSHTPLIQPFVIILIRQMQRTSCSNTATAKKLTLLAVSHQPLPGCGLRS